MTEKVSSHLLAALAILEREQAAVAGHIRALRSALGSAASKSPAAGSEAEVSDKPVTRRRRRRKLSAEARSRIAAAQKLRWAEFHKKQKAYKA